MLPQKPFSSVGDCPVFFAGDFTIEHIGDFPHVNPLERHFFFPFCIGQRYVAEIIERISNSVNILSQIA